MARFTATYGVSFADLGVAFVFDPEATGTSQDKVYAAEVDAKTAVALKKLPADVRAEYGIREDK